jgi:hypothetical protein
MLSAIISQGKSLMVLASEIGPSMEWREPNRTAAQVTGIGGPRQSANGCSKLTVHQRPVDSCPSFGTGHCEA